MKLHVKIVAGLALVALTTALCWAYPRTVLLEVFTNYG
jgi:hypothetical protein